MEKTHDVGNEVQDSGRAMYPITRNKLKELVIPVDVDTPANDELSSGNSLRLGLSPTKNTRAKLCKRTSHRPTFSDAISDASRRARRGASKG